MEGASNYTNSAIYADLMKYAGRIVAVHVEPTDASRDIIPPAKKPTRKADARMQTMASKTAPVGKTLSAGETGSSDPTRQLASDATIDEIIARLPPNIQPLRDAAGVVHDTATVAATCAKNHLHKYFLSEAALAKCPTCTGGTKFTTMVREAAETLFGVPFVMGARTPLVTEFSNLATKITITCGGGCADGFTIGDVCKISIRTTTSIKKITGALNTAGIAHGVIEPPVVPPPKVRVGKDPLPVGRAMADDVAARAHNPILARMEMNIVDDVDLAIENL